MNKTQFISKLLSTHWGLDNIRGRTILSGLIRPMLPSAPGSERPAEDICGDPLPKMQLLGEIALIPITGVIAIDVPDWIKSYGLNLTDVNDITEEIEEAIEDANVQRIIFDVNSPGGMSIAGNKLFEDVEAANRKKPCFAYCGAGRDMASAAYNSVAACTALSCSPFADGVGCIGSYLAYLDDTDWWTKMGMKWEIFPSGDLKGIGESVPLTQVQKDFLQSQSDYYGANIRRNVKKYRTQIADDDLTGGWWDGKQAAKKGFVYSLDDDLQTALSKFKRLTRAAA